jgi:hypothetical protein
MNSEPSQAKTGTYAILFLKTNALMSSFFWLYMAGGLATLMLVLLELLNRYSLYVDLPEVYVDLPGVYDHSDHWGTLWQGGIYWVLGYLSTMLIAPEEVRRRLRRVPWRSRRLWLLFAGLFLGVFGLPLFEDAQESVLYYEGWDLIWTLTISLLFALVITALLALGTELTLIVAAHVLLQLRGWRKLPFEGWDRSNLWRFGHGSRDFGRWPKPVSQKMSIEQAKAYAQLATATARQRGILGEAIALVCGGALGTSLALLFSAPSIDWSLHPLAILVTVFSVAFGIMGLRMSTFAAAMWESRAKDYATFAADRTTRARWKSARARMK